MSELGHDLNAEFPDHRATLRRLKSVDPRFPELAGKHHTLTQEIYRIEQGLEPASDERLEDLKKKRLQLLDTIAALIANEEEG